MATSAVVKFHSPTPELAPGAGLVITQRPVPKGEGQKYAPEIEYEEFNEERSRLTTVEELFSSGSCAGLARDRDALATHTRLGNPQVVGEFAYLPVEPPHMNIGGNATLTSLLGRLWDPTLHIYGEDPVAASDTEQHFSLAHHLLVPGHVGMRAEANEARKNGGWSVWESYLESNADIILLCEVLGIGEDGIPAEERDALHARGSIVLRGMVDTREVHSVETLLALTEPVVGSTPNDHTYNIDYLFADAIAMREGFSQGGVMSDLFESAVERPDLAEARHVLVGTMYKILNPTTDFADRKQAPKSIEDDNGNKWTIPKNLAGRIEELYGYISKHEGSASEPARTLFRAHLRLEELDMLQSPTIDGRPNPEYRPNAQEAIKRERQRVWFGLAHMFQYLFVIDRAKHLQNDYQEKSIAKDFNGARIPTHPATQADPVRLEFMAFDELDDLIGRIAAEGLKKLKDDKITTGQRVLQEMLDHLMHGKRNPGLGDNFYVNVHGAPNPAKGKKFGNYYHRFFDTVVTSDNGADVVAHGVKTHQGMPYGSKGAYAFDEVFSSLFATQDPKENPNFPHGGLLCSGVATAGELHIPETLPDASSVQGRIPKLVGISLKYAPDLFRQAIYGPVVAAGSLETQRAVWSKIIDSNLDLAAVVANPNIVYETLGKLAPGGPRVMNEHAWRLLAEVDAQPEGTPNADGSTSRLSKRIEPMLGGVLRNGEAVAMVRADLVVGEKPDGTKIVATQAVPVRGKIKGEKPKVRVQGKIRQISHAPIEEPTWISPTDSKGRVIRDADGDPITVKPLKKRGDGSTFRRENRLFDARFAREDAWINRLDEKDARGRPVITDAVARQFRVFTRVHRTKVLGREVRELVKPQ